MTIAGSEPTSPRDIKSKPELMSPAGGWPQLRAAVEAGADAVYFGLDHFSARAKVGFQVSELNEIFDFLHLYDVKGFVTLNTLIFDDELEHAEQSIGAIASAGADAVIVQDIGIAKLVSDIAPELEIHGSTQMSVTSAEGVDFASLLGCKRVVLGRELSLDDIRKITEVASVATEVFVHGALCVSYSGQCFSSEAWGGRSANRGQCAQACRLSYELIVAGSPHETGSNRYLLSPGDLYALEHIPQLMALGVSCFKIEGRYKDEYYVAATTRAYRRAIDSAWEQISQTNLEQTKFELEQVYSRGLGAHFVNGTNHQQVVEGRAPRHRGIQIGKVTAIAGDAVIVDLRHDVYPGDGLVFDAADWRSLDLPEEGGNVYRVEKLQPTIVKLYFANHQIDYHRIRAGDLVWRTSAPKLVQLLKPVAKPTRVSRKSQVDFNVIAIVGSPLVVTAKVYSQVLGKTIEVTKRSKLMVQPSSQQSLSHQSLSEQFGRLGGTPLQLKTLNYTAESPAFFPVSQINELRRDLVAQLIKQRRRAPIFTRPRVVENWLRDQALRVARFPEVSKTGSDKARLHLLVRDGRQLSAAIEVAPDSITLDYLELYGLRTSVERVIEAGIEARVASPRILKPSEQNVIRFLHSLGCSLVVRSGGLLLDLLKLEKHSRPILIGDFSLNVANVVAAQLLLDMGLDFITPTYDLNGQQVSRLATKLDPRRLEVIAYSHLPVFHTEHCVFCRFLSDGTDSSNCGHPCEKQQVAVRDRTGREHPVLADVGCRNTIFGAEAQFSAEYLQRWLNVKIENIRLEFVHETAEELYEIGKAAKNALAKRDTKRLDSVVRRCARGGITAGSLFVAANQENIYC